MFLALLACLLFPASSVSAAVPRGFVGMNVDGPALEPGVDVADQLRAVRRAGAESVRWAIYWPEVQPFRAWADVPPERRNAFEDVHGVPTDLGKADRFVAAASRAGLTPLPVLMSAAPWIAENPFVPFSPPADPAAYGRFAGMLAARYGTRGSFWREHPRLRRRPVVAWQIWNEAAGADGFGSPTHFWRSERDPLSVYLAMLRAAKRAIVAADPRGRVVLGGFFGRAWIAVEQLYSAGGRSSFDAVAIHPYTRHPRNVVRLLRLVRAEMARHGDAAKPLLVTELSWPAAVGRITEPYPFSVDASEQAQLLRRGFQLLARERRRLRLDAVYWYTWITRDASSTDDFDYAGLLTLGPDGRLRLKPAFRSFRRTARRLTN